MGVDAAVQNHHFKTALKLDKNTVIGDPDNPIGILYYVPPTACDL
jgi:hypothetical protein